jgi:general secretion pathway protein F
MPIYEYTALSESGQSKSGILDADTPRAARDKLRKDKVHVTSIRLAGDLTGSATAKKDGSGGAARLGRTLFRRRVRISTQDLSTFTRQFATLLKSGTPMTESMRVLIEQTSGRRFEAILRDVRERVTGGEPLADALGNHPGVFSDLYINMVRAGEASGRLDDVLVRIGEFLQRQARMRNKVMSALMYPIIMCVVGAIVVVVLMNFVVPKILKLVTAKSGVLPLPTRILKATSDFFSDYWLLLAAAGVALFLLPGALRRTEKGAYFLDKLKLRMPVFGDLFRKPFAVTLSTLLKSGSMVRRAEDRAERRRQRRPGRDRGDHPTGSSRRGHRLPCRKARCSPRRPHDRHREQSGQLEGIRRSSRSPTTRRWTPRRSG